MQELVKKLFPGKKIIIAGFGREGRSTYKLIRCYLPELHLTITDRNREYLKDPAISHDTHLTLRSGSNYLADLDSYDIIIKSPGIPSKDLDPAISPVKITSQTDLFLRQFHKQIIGVTGTKGKSTTSSLIYHILKKAGRETVLVGNIGLPPFEIAGKITPDTVIVMELSSHQLEFLDCSPHIAILLNIFQEHLDHYHSYIDYQSAKFNIGLHQQEDDYFIYNASSEIIEGFVAECTSCRHYVLPFKLDKPRANGIGLVNEKLILSISDKQTELFDLTRGLPLKGSHNIANVMAASAACYLAGIPADKIAGAILTFKGLEHRIEYVGYFEGIHFYNDSIATIPEATIEAVNTLKEVDTLILGGFDRGIDYSFLIPYLLRSPVRNIILTGAAGERMKIIFDGVEHPGLRLFEAADYKEVVEIAKRETMKGKICLLSPAAASYDMFKNFEERGNIYKKMVKE
jgi:UDP-N-acetylmuramoyl-L-alanine---L-glutamate ligase